MASGTDILLEVEGLEVRFATPRGVVRAVDGVSLTVRKGEAIGIVGESGSGKSMSALSVLRLVPKPGHIVGGKIRFDGRDLLALDEPAIRAVRRSEIATIFQDAGSYLNPVMTIEDQVAEAIGRRGSKDAADRARVVAALRAVEIADPIRVAASYPHELSGGMQQRVMIASVLIRRPRLILADEPTTALDATVQYQILKSLAALRADLNASLVLISHDLAVVAEVCDRVYVMYAGQIVEEGPTTRLFSFPKHPYTQALVGSMLDPFVPKTEVTALEGSPPDMADPPSGCRFHPRCPRVFTPCEHVEPTMFDFPAGQSAKCWLHAPAEAAFDAR
jgi:oligopeptide/dipeptide ABC transporter ATP-binding protein